MKNKTIYLKIADLNLILIFCLVLKKMEVIFLKRAYRFSFLYINILVFLILCVT